MALIFADRIKETTTTTGVGDITLSGNPDGFRAFSSALTTNDTFYYCIDGGSQWEIGLGTYNVDGTIERTTVSSNSIGDTSNINFLAGTKTMFITVSAAFWAGLTTSISSAAALPENLIFEYEVTGSAVTTITTNGTITLDIVTDGAYEIWFECISATATDGYIYLYVNNDVTNGNYTTRQINSAGTSLTTSVVALPYFDYTYETGQYGFVVANLSLVNTHACCATKSVSDNATYARTTNIYKTTTDTNITRLDITCATASGIGIGSKVKIFKRKY